MEQTGFAAGLHCGALKNGRNKGPVSITIPVTNRVVKFIEPLTFQDIGNLRIVKINCWTTIAKLDYDLHDERNKKLIQERLRIELGRDPLKSEIATEHLKREIPANRTQTLQTFRKQSEIIERGRRLPGNSLVRGSTSAESTDQNFHYMLILRRRLSLRINIAGTRLLR